MNMHDVTLAGVRLRFLGTGALYWPDEGLLAVSDLHLGRSERFARNAGALLPPYETQDTLKKLEAAIEATGARAVVCVGDSFDDARAAHALDPQARDWIARLMAGRRWIWVEGNHDPGPIELGGTHMAELALGPLTFRHIAEPGAVGEISGHYHPKARLAGRARPCLLIDETRAILPAFGSYTGGLLAHHEALAGLMGPQALAVLTGPTPMAIPMPR